MTVKLIQVKVGYGTILDNLLEICNNQKVRNLYPRMRPQEEGRHAINMAVTIKIVIEDTKGCNIPQVRESEGEDSRYEERS